MKHHRANIILSVFSIPFVLKCAAKILKIGLQIKIKRQKLFLNRDFCMGKSVAREVIIFLKKFKSLNSLSTMHKTNPK